MLTIDRLKYFKEVAQTEHVGKAAKSAHISPSVISSAISALEEEFECSLFDKEKNRLKLNTNGQFLLEKANKILSDLDSIYTEITDSPVQLKGHYRLSGSPTLVNDFLIEAFLNIQKDHPEATAEFKSSDTSAACANIVAGITDLALVYKSFQYHDVDETVLYQGQFHFCARKNHPIFKARKAERAKLLNELPAISFRPTVGTSPYEDHPIFKKLGITPKHSYFYENNHSSVKLLSLTDGWAFLPDNLIKLNSCTIKKISLNNSFDAPMRISLIKNKNRGSIPLYELLVEFLRREFNK
jgi:DNA-binding transcriptional LysR family regulator